MGTETYIYSKAASLHINQFINSNELTLDYIILLVCLPFLLVVYIFTCNCVNKTIPADHYSNHWLTLLFSRADAECNSLDPKQLWHLSLLKMFGWNFWHLVAMLFMKTTETVRVLQVYIPFNAPMLFVNP